MLGLPATVFLGDSDHGLRLASGQAEEGNDRLRLASASLVGNRVTIAAAESEGADGYEPRPLAAVPMCTESRALGAIVIDGASEPATLDLLASLGALAGTVIEQREHARTTAAEARIDALTGLANKRSFHERLETELDSVTKESPLSVILLDVDNFKAINDREGHLVGDRVLGKVARVALAALRVGEDIFRLGGEEFAVLVHADKRNAERVANRIRDGLSAQRRDTPLPTISAGVATAPGDGRTAEVLLHKADVALYAAKERGRDRVITYEPAAEDNDRSEREEREQQLEAGWWLKVLGAAARARHEDELGPGWLPQDVAHLCDLVAVELGLTADQRESVVLAAVLAELCKLTLPDSIRRKATRLTAREWSLLRTRTERLVAALSPIPHLAAAMPILTSCRERWDGRGHPGRLRGRDIPVGSRIVSVCEAYCALTQPRSYRPARTQARALLELQELAGSRFDPVCVAALHAVSERGSLAAGPAGVAA